MLSGARHHKARQHVPSADSASPVACVWCLRRTMVRPAADMHDHSKQAVQGIAPGRIVCCVWQLQLKGEHHPVHQLALPAQNIANMQDNRQAPRQNNRQCDTS